MPVICFSKVFSKSEAKKYDNDQSVAKMILLAFRADFHGYRSQKALHGNRQLTVFFCVLNKIQHGFFRKEYGSCVPNTIFLKK